MIPDLDKLTEPVSRRPSKASERLKQSVWNFPDKAGGLILRNTSYGGEGELRPLLIKGCDTERERRRTFTKAAVLTIGALAAATTTICLATGHNEKPTESPLSPSHTNKDLVANIEEAEVELSECLSNMPQDLIRERPELGHEGDKTAAYSICYSRFDETVLRMNLASND